ncbi:bacteriophage N4 adsorption protein B [alpha proteobacterium Q-1]|nr:bacteriophage N4 adsorption protein B [alpha proteobacterium Q-1]
MDAADALHAGLNLLVWIIAALILLSGLDDLFIDLATHYRSLSRSLTIYRKSARANSQSLPVQKQKPIAIFLPAWNESDVIAPMLKRLRRSLRYDHYVVFLGVYPNDRETAIKARAVDREQSWLKILCLDHDGPTSKGDCLNHLWRALIADPAYDDFQQIILHDAEDVVHPDELQLFNYLADRADLIQLPVIPLPPPLRSLVGGHYLDEFAESHQKDLVLREWMAGGIPCAGVGCAFSRKALSHIAQISKAPGPFPQHSLTEDYELALMLLKLGYNSIFVRLPESEDQRAVIATREYFPTAFKAAVSQKSRWLIGIVLQSWKSQGWPGSLAMRYMLMRDRKAILTAFMGVAAYVLVLALALYEGARHAHLTDMPPIIDPRSPLMMLLFLNAGLLINRAGHRAFYTGRLYGWQQGLFSIPRVFIGNLVNCAAAWRALRLYLVHLFHGTPLQWEKTSHLFPDDPADLAADLAGDLEEQTDHEGRR